MMFPEPTATIYQYGVCKGAHVRGCSAAASSVQQLDQGRVAGGQRPALCKPENTGPSETKWAHSHGAGRDQPDHPECGKTNGRASPMRLQPIGRESGT